MKRYNLIYLMCLMVFFSCKKEVQISKKMDETFYLKRDGADMPVRVRGNGKSGTYILVISGGPGDGGARYAHHTYSDMLEEKYGVIYWDQRHQGNSHGHLKSEEITIDRMVEDTYALIQVIKQRYGSDISLFMLGHSWGGALGTAFMVKNDYQNEVKGWIESGGGHDFPLINKAIVSKIKGIAPIEIAAGRNVEKWDEMLNYVSDLDTNNITAEQATKLNSFGAQSEGLIETLPDVSQSSLSGAEMFLTDPDNSFTTLINEAQLPESLYIELLDLSLSNELHKITKPTLLLWGEYDFRVPKRVGKVALEQLGSTNKELIVYPNAGHSSMRYNPEAFVEDVVEFIEKHK